MSSIWHNLAQVTEYFHKSSEPLDEDGARPVPAFLTRKLEDIDYRTRHGPPFSLADLPAYIDAVKNFSGVGLDDRKFLLEKLLVLMSRLPPDSEFSNKLQQSVIEILYKDLPHPVASYLSLPPTNATAPILRNVKYPYRSTDGSDNNPLFPTMGRAGMPYARSVPSLNPTPVSRLPDPALLFDTLLRRDKFVPHPGGISSLFFAFANLIIHTVFDTSHKDWTINNASSYLDLSVLYGSSDRQVNAVRRKDGTGKLWEDVFADSRLLFMTPSTVALLVLFSRNHNYIAEKLLSINENGNFTNPPPSDPTACSTQDDEIFHRSRLINCGFFVQVIFRDYVGAILGLVRDGSTWRLDPLKASRELGHEPFPQGEGNTVSLEFNLLYRWHATVSSQDTQWTEELFTKLFPGKDFDSVTVDDFEKAARTVLIPDPDVKKWTFGGLARGADGRFSDVDLATILQGATEAAASAFKARGIPSVLRVIEIMGIEQSRSWGACSLNEFRTFMGLKPYSSFAEWNPNPEIHTAAAALYHHIDNLELHVGMQAEETKVPMPGAGLCPGYTISRTILADAVCLTRGDRFFTVDFTPFNFTSWGYNDCQTNIHDGSFGGMLSKLLFRHLPDYYPAGSAYAIFPFMVPQTMKGYVAAQSDHPVNKYIWTKPSLTIQPPISFETRIKNITKGPIVDVKQVLFSPEAIEAWRECYMRITKQLIQSKSATRTGSSGKYLDIVKDVINFAPVHWIANDVMGLSLKTSDNPSGVYREQEFYDMFANVANYVFANLDGSQDFFLREESLNTFGLVSETVTARLNEASPGLIASLLLDFSRWKSDSRAFLHKLASTTGAPARTLAESLCAETLTTAARYSKAMAHVVDYFLRDKMADLRNAIAAGAPGLDAQIVSGIKDALRAKHSTTTGENGITKSVSSEADTYGMMTPKFFEKTATQILRTIFSLPGVKRVPGLSGQLDSFKNEVTRGVVQEAYIDLNGQITPWPVSLVIQYD